MTKPGNPLGGPIVTLEEYEELHEELVGVCISCGNQQDNIDPDGREIPCEVCEEPTVYGLEELLIMGHVG